MSEERHLGPSSVQLVESAVKKGKLVAQFMPSKGDETIKNVDIKSIIFLPESNCVKFRDIQKQAITVVALSEEDLKTLIDARERSRSSSGLKNVPSPKLISTSTQAKRILHGGDDWPSPAPVRPNFVNTYSKAKPLVMIPSISSISRAFPSQNFRPAQSVIVPPVPVLSAPSTPQVKKVRVVDESAIERVDDSNLGVEASPSADVDEEEGYDFLKQMRKKNDSTKSLSAVFEVENNKPITPSKDYSNFEGRPKPLSAPIVPRPPRPAFMELGVPTRVVPRQLTTRPPLVRLSLDSSTGPHTEIPELMSVKPEPVLSKRKGFPNSSFVCYCNAIVQALVSCQKLENEVINEFWLEVLNKRNTDMFPVPIFEGLRDTFLASHSGGFVNPSNLIRSHIGPRFANTGVQHDAHEFLLELFEKMNVELAGDDVANRENRGMFVSQLMRAVAQEYPEFDISRCSVSQILPSTRTFEALMSKTIVCESCHTSRSGSPETFLVHSLDFMTARESSVPVNLESLLEANVMDDSVKELKCESCVTGRHAKINTRFARLPRVLIVHIKRFINFDGDTSKRRDAVEVSSTLSLKRLLAQNMDTMTYPPITSPISNEAKSAAEYQLVAGVFHRGRGATSGHYTTVGMDAETKEWLLFDDLSVTRVSSDWYKHNVARRDGYLFFYTLMHDAA